MREPAAPRVYKSTARTQSSTSAGTRTRRRPDRPASTVGATDAIVRRPHRSGLSSKLLVLEALATWPEEHGGQEGIFDIEQTDALATEFAQEILAAEPAELAAEPLAARLLQWWSKYGGPDTASTINTMLANDDLLLAVLAQSMIYGRAVRMGEAAARLIPRIRWQQLTAVLEESTLQQRITELENQRSRPDRSTYGGSTRRRSAHCARGG